MIMYLSNTTSQELIDAIINRTPGYSMIIVQHWTEWEYSNLGEFRNFETLIDYANREIYDTFHTCSSMAYRDKISAGGLSKTRLNGIRIDTCGENWMQNVPKVKADKYYLNSGVCVWGVNDLVRKLNDAYGIDRPKVVLSSGFGDYEKVKAYVDYEKQIGYKLFDTLGIGAIYDCIITTADIVEIEGDEIHKIGRPFRPNPALRRVV